MAEYIERNLAAQCFDELLLSPYASPGNGFSAGVRDALILAKNMMLNKVPRSLAIPAADVAPVRRGRWLGGEYDGYADGAPVFDTLICSQCGAEYDADIADTANYCPNCGAKMEEEEK